MLQEILVVCRDALVLRPIASAVRNTNVRLNCATSVGLAGELLLRRRADAVFVDMALPRAAELVSAIRASSANRGTVIFACVSNAEALTATFTGASFVLNRPITSDKIANMLRLASSAMRAEKRRYFRHPLMVPVNLKVNGRELESTMANLSEGGMAIWSLHYHPRGTHVEFSFELPFGGEISGCGKITWTDPQGLAGVRFNLLTDEQYSVLAGWIFRSENRLSA
jgi:DNA-binding response OmpR family regulator